MISATRILASFMAIGLVGCGFNAAATAQYSVSAAVPDQWKPGFVSINETDSEALVKVIASEHFAGRGTGQDGYVKAAYFVAGKLAEFGFEPLGDNDGYFQNLPFARIGPNLATSSLKIGDRMWNAESQIGFVSFDKPELIHGSIVFLSAKGKELKVGDPGRYRNRIVVLNADSTGLSFLRPLLQSKPAVILQIVDDKPQNRSRVVRGGGTGSGGKLRAQITRQLAGELAEVCEVPVELVRARSEEGTSFQVTDSEMQIDLKIVDKPLRVPNVVGWLEGSDPEVNHEYIVIGAHLDHLGQRDGKTFPGADDNASGSAAILQIAKALQINKVRPRRSLIYIAFAGEEIGLVGSRYFVKHPPRPLEDCICMFNIDMIGRNEETDKDDPADNEQSIHLVGTKRRYPKLHETVLQANQYVGFEFEYDEERVARRSDQQSFADKKIPNTFLFGGFNPYYHQTTDTLDGINYSKIANAARLNYACIFLASEHGHYREAAVEQIDAEQTDAEQSAAE